MRAIDANRLLEERRIHTYYHLPNGDIAIPLIDIKNAPTIEPEQIVRCKDCIMQGVCRFEQGLGLNGYCSQAERRTDEGD